MAPVTERLGPNNGINPPKVKKVKEKVVSGASDYPSAEVWVYRTSSVAGVFPDSLSKFLGTATVKADGTWKLKRKIKKSWVVDRTSERHDGERLRAHQGQAAQTLNQGVSFSKGTQAQRLAKIRRKKRKMLKTSRKIPAARGIVSSLTGPAQTVEVDDHVAAEDHEAEDRVDQRPAREVDEDQDDPEDDQRQQAPRKRIR